LSWRGLRSSALTPESLGSSNPETTPTQFQPPPRRDHHHVRCAVCRRPPRTGFDRRRPSVTFQRSSAFAEAGTQSCRWAVTSLAQTIRGPIRQALPDGALYESRPSFHSGWRDGSSRRRGPRLHPSRGCDHAKSSDLAHFQSQRSVRRCRRPVSRRAGKEDL
jgi:hypothetical protein